MASKLFFVLAFIAAVSAQLPGVEIPNIPIPEGLPGAGAGASTAAPEAMMNDDNEDYYYYYEHYFDRSSNPVETMAEGMRAAVPGGSRLTAFGIPIPGTK